MNSANVQSMVQSLVQGEYNFELKVTDNMGLSASDTISVKVIPESNTNSLNNKRRDFYLTLPLDSVYFYTTQDYNTPCSEQGYIQVSGPNTVTIEHRWEEWLAKDLIPGTYIFKGSSFCPAFVDTLAIHVIDEPLEKNTITYTNLWKGFGNGYPTYGAGIFNQVNVAAVLRQQPIPQFYFRLNVSSEWKLLPAYINGEHFTPHWEDNIVVLGSPQNSSWEIREWQIKIKL